MTARARLSLTVDDEHRILLMRYLGAIEGDEINLSMMQQVSQLDRPWLYDSIIDMRRFDGAVLTSDIEELGLRWALLAQGRDKGRLTAVISEDPLVRARQSLTQGAFPFRTLGYFENFDEGLEWIKAQGGRIDQAVA